MKIDFFIHEKFKEPEVRICNNELNDQVKQLREFIDQTVNIAVMGYSQREVRMLRCSEIYRIYSENQKTIAETKTESYQVHSTLAQMEQQMPEGEFVRISRSEIVNIRQIKKLDTSIARTIQMSLKNGTQTFVSRRNVSQIKKILGLWEDKNMIKKSLSRACISFAASTIIAQIVTLLIQVISGNQEVALFVPSYRAFFPTAVMALNVYYLLVGLIGAAFGACSVIFELEKWSWIKQGVIHFLLTTVVWLPLATFLWGLYQYPRAVFSTAVSMAVTYAIIWGIQYQVCKNNIDKINQKLREME